jgi:hypothetical protein
MRPSLASDYVSNSTAIGTTTTSTAVEDYYRLARTHKIGVANRSEATLADRPSGPQLDAHAPSQSVIVAYVTGDDRHADVRRTAEEHARTRGCTLILFVADAASVWSEPMPNQWASEGEADRFGSRLGPDDLELLGRSDVQGQVVDGRQSGVDSYAWLPKDHGPGALVGYAREQGARMIFVPNKLEWIDALSSLLSGGPTDGEELATPRIEIRVVASEPAGADPD